MIAALATPVLILLLPAHQASSWQMLAGYGAKDSAFQGLGYGCMQKTATIFADICLRYLIR